jgi:hypothetical protein
VLNEAKNRLYVMTRFDDAISVVDTSTASQIAHLAAHNPEPASVVNGRPVLYDAVLSSSNGEASCASCHVFGDFDSLAWDLGNPDDVLLNNPNPFTVGGASTFHPMKGPMTTQSLRGMANHGPMHWRGDRTGGNDVGGNALDESQAFKKFIVAFDGLLGRGSPIPDAQMQAFTDFILQVTYPPNPVRDLTNSLNGAQQAGHDLFFGAVTDVVANCNGCHVLDPANGFFGGNGNSSIEGETQEFKIPHLRNLYQKVGMFGMPAVQFFKTGDNGPKGDQVRGFGFLHDGSTDTLFRFHHAQAFNFGDPEAANLEQFMLAMDSNLAPIVGQQITLTSTNAAVVGPRIDLLIARVVAGECQLTVKGTLAGQQRGWLRVFPGNFTSDRASEPALTDAQLRAQAATPGQERTYLCVPPGSGTRVGIDRDEDGFRDRDELDAGSDPADPSSQPSGTTTSTTSVGTTTSTSSTTLGNTFTPIPTKKVSLKDRSTAPADPSRRRISFKSVTSALLPSFNRIDPPSNGTADDPTLVGGAVVAYNSGGLGHDLVIVGLPAAGWIAKGPNTYEFKAASTAAITKVVIRPDQISVKGGRAQWGYTLDEPAQGRVAVALILGHHYWCSDTPAKASGNPPSTAKNDRVDKFVGQSNSPAPGFCASPP